ncbi:hypothetical protein ACHWQZ_G017656 [Mnemiopsis leidyi]
MVKDQSIGTFNNRQRHISSVHFPLERSGDIPVLFSAKPLSKETPDRKCEKKEGKRESIQVIYTAGRPPWYDSTGHQEADAFVIGLCGGSASGKTSVAKVIVEASGVPWVVILSQDCFYKEYNEKEKELIAKNEFNFDHPDAFDFALIYKTLKKLKSGKQVKVPVYDYVTHRRKKVWNTVYGANVVIFEGILAFADKRLTDLMDLKVFVDTDSDIRLARRLKRDISDRGRDLTSVLKQYNTFVKPSFDTYIAPTMSLADIVIPQGVENDVALQLIIRHVKRELDRRGYVTRSKTAPYNDRLTELPLPDGLDILPSTSEVKVLLTIIRDKTTSRDDFIFYSQRLMRLLLEHSLTFLPVTPEKVTTFRGEEYDGVAFTGKLCAVSIVRAGEVMETAIHSVVKDISIGKILIQTCQDTGEPALHYLRLPYGIANMHVILMDATVATGAAAMMAIRILLDHEVPEESISFVCLIASKPGVQAIAYAFPKVRIIVGEMDPDIDEYYHICPGLGNFGDRFFGTS